MKTILVVYTNKANLSKKEISGLKKYSFNTASNVSVGDLIDSTEYTTYMLVIKVLEKSYLYFNAATGELSDEFNSTAQWNIRTIVIREEEEDVIYGKIVNKL
jgi:hypothetical protein